MALNEVFARAIPLLKRWASGRLPRWARDMIDTDDLVQETVVSTLKHIVEDRVGVTIGNTPNRWLRTSAQLARLYRKNGQEDSARAVEAHLLKLLAAADIDHPLVVDLRRRR